MELDKNQVSGNTMRPPQTHTRGVDPTPEFSSLALPKACGDKVDCGPSSSIPSTNASTPLSLADYMDFLKRALWKEYHRVTKTPTVGRYLDVL